MQEISLDLEAELNASSQQVHPLVGVTLADSKYAYGLQCFSSSVGWDDTISDLNPIAWYKFDDTDEDILRDHSENNLHMANLGSTYTTGATGPIGYGDDGCFDFSAAGNGFSVDHSDVLDIPENRQFSVGVWWRPETYASGTTLIFGKSDTVAYDDTEWGFIESAGSPSTYSFVYSDGASLFYLNKTPNTETLNQWVFLAATITETEIKFYVNGILADSATILDPIPQTSSDLRIGARTIGKIDEAFITHKAIPAGGYYAIYSGATSTATDEWGDFFSPYQLMNGLKEETLPQLELDGIDDLGNPAVANGEFFAMPEDLDHSKYEVGWRSRQTSNGSGDMTFASVITCTFEPRLANYIDIYFTHSKGNIKTYYLYYMDGNGDTVQVGSTQTVASDEEYQRISLDGIITITGVIIVVLTTRFPNDYARIHEIDPVLVMDVSDDVVNFELSSSRENFEDTLPIGHNVSNTFDVTLDNHDKRFSPYGSKLYRHLIHPEIDTPALFSEASLLLRASSVDGDTYAAGDPWVNEGTLGTDYNAVLATIDDPGNFDTVTNLYTPQYIGGAEPAFQIGDGYSSPSMAGFMVPYHSNFDIPTSSGGLTLCFDITPLDVDDPSYKIVWKYAGIALAQSLNRTYGANGGGWVIECIDDVGSGPGSGGLLSGATDGRFGQPGGGNSIPGDPDPEPWPGGGEGWCGAVGNKNPAGRQTITVVYDRTNDLVSLYRNNTLVSSGVMNTMDESISATNILIGQDSLYHNIAIFPRALSESEVHQLHLDMRYYYNVETSSYLTPNVKFDAYLKWEGADDIVRQGTFYTDTWATSSSDMTVTASCRDSSKMFEEVTEEDGVFYEDTTVGAAIANLIRKNGFPNSRVRYYENYNTEISLSYPVSHWALGTAYDDEAELVEAEDDSQSYDATFISDLFGTHYGTINGDLTVGNQALIPSEPDSYSMLSVGTDESYVSIADHADLDLSTAWTVEAVVQFTALNDQIILSKITSLSTPNNNQIQLSLYNGDFIAAVTDGSDTSNVVVVTSSATVEVGETYHVAVVFDGANSELRIVVDGVENVEDAFATCQTNNNPFALCGTSLTVGSNVNLKGYLQSVAVFDRVLSLDEITEHYVASKLENIKRFPYIYGIDASINELILEWATADLGVFYFDKDGVFHYEYRNTIHDPNIDQHAISQYDLSDSTNIIDGSIDIELQSNKVTVEVNPITSINSDRQSIWRAEDNESLAIAGLRNPVDFYDTQIDVNSTEKVPWKNKGYLKIDDEIMSYDGKDGKTFLNVKRGLFDTSPASHQGGTSWTFDDGCDFWTSQKNDDGELLEDESTLWEESNCVLIHDTTNYRTGGGALKVRSTVGGAGGTNKIMGPSSPRNKDAEEIRPGVSYSVSAYTKAKTTPRATRIRIVWFDADGRYISFSQTSSPVTNSTSSWTQVTHTANAPSNAKYAALRVVFKNIADGEVHYIDDVSFPGTRCKVREVRVYDLDFDQAPCIGVKFPLLVAADFEGTAEIDKFTHTNFGAHVVVSATKKAPIDSIVYLEGTDPLTDLNYYFAISGIPLVEKNSGESVDAESSDVSSELPDQIKRYGLKTLTITNKFVQDKECAQIIADWLIEHYSDPIPILNLTVTGLPHFELGDRITVTSFDQFEIVNEDYWVMSNSISYDGGISQSLMLRRVS